MDNPSPMDICCGRGKGKWNSPGNRRFKELVLKYLKDYESAPSKAEKSKVVEAVVKVVKDMGGRFVRHDDSAGQWYEIRPEERRAKVAHCIRDHLATTKKNSNRSSSSDAGQHSLSHRKQGRSDSHSDRERSRGSLARAQQEPARELSPILSSQSHYSARLQENENANARSSFPREGHADLALGLGHDHLPLASTTGSLLDRNFASRPSSDHFQVPITATQDAQTAYAAQLFSQVEADNFARSSLFLHGHSAGAPSYLLNQHVFNQQSLMSPPGTSPPFLPFYPGQMGARMGVAQLDHNLRGNTLHQEGHESALIGDTLGRNLASSLPSMQGMGVQGASLPFAQAASLPMNSLTSEIPGLSDAARLSDQEQSANFVPIHEPSQRITSVAARQTDPAIPEERGSSRRAKMGSFKPSWDFIEEEFAQSGGGDMEDAIEPNSVFPPHEE